MKQLIKKYLGWLKDSNRPMTATAGNNYISSAKFKYMKH